MVAASLIKLYIMGASFRQFKEGKFYHDEAWPSVRKMIVTSDNWCAKWLLYRLGEGVDAAAFDEVNSFAHEIGSSSTVMNRTLLDTDSGLENYTSAEDVALFFKLLYRYELISPEYSAEMLEFLKAQTINDRIPAGLPAKTVCAHKTGDLQHICCADAAQDKNPTVECGEWRVESGVEGVSDELK